MSTEQIKSRWSWIELCFGGAILFSSFDIFMNVRIGFNFRLAQLFALGAILGVLVLVLRKRRTFRWPAGFGLLVPWAIWMLLLISRANMLTRSAGYGAWLVFNITTVWAMVVYFDRAELITKLIRWYLISFCLLAGWAMIQFVLPLLGGPGVFVTQWWVPGHIARVNGFCYEPSYFAAYMLLGWITASVLMYKKDVLPGRLVPLTWALSSAALVICSARSGWMIMLLWLVICNAAALLVRLKRKTLSLGQIRPACYWAVFFCGLAVAYWAVLRLPADSNDVQGAGAVASKKADVLRHTGLDTETPAVSWDDRRRPLLDTLRVFAKNPLVGYGLGDVAYQIGALRGTPPRTLEEAKPFEAINVFAEALAASGVFGFAVFMGYWCVLLGKGVKYVKQAKDTELGVLLKALLWALVIELVLLQISPTILRTYLWVHIGILCAVMSRETLICTRPCAMLSRNT